MQVTSVNSGGTARPRVSLTSAAFGAGPPGSNEEEVGPERRAAKRISAAELPWIKGIALANVGVAGLINLSSSGALLHCRTRLVPSQEVVLQIIGAGSRFRVKGHVVRCEVSAVRKGSTIDYRAAIAFDPDPCPLPVSAHLSIGSV